MSLTLAEVERREREEDRLVLLVMGWDDLLLSAYHLNQGALLIEAIS